MPSILGSFRKIDKAADCFDSQLSKGEYHRKLALQINSPSHKYANQEEINGARSLGSRSLKYPMSRDSYALRMYRNCRPHLDDLYVSPHSVLLNPQFIEADINSMKNKAARLPPIMSGALGHISGYPLFRSAWREPISVFPRIWPTLTNFRVTDGRAMSILGDFKNIWPNISVMTRLVIQPVSPSFLTRWGKWFKLNSN